MKFPVGLVENSAGVGDSFGVWYLDRERIYFDVEEDIPTDPRLILKEKKFPHKEEPDLKDPENRQSLTWMMDMERIFPKFSLHHEALLPAPSKESSVGVQVVIDRGVLASSRFTRAVWNCDQIPPSATYRQVFTHEVELFIGGLKGGKAVAVNFNDPGSRKSLDLAKLPQINGEVAVRIFNVCDKNPLEWLPLPDPEPDQDTKWFFELIEPTGKENLRRFLGTGEVPIPKPYRPFNPGDFGSPGSGNCIVTKLGSSKFSLPRLVRVIDRDEEVY
jgi:hypothetical protein